MKPYALYRLTIAAVAIAISSGCTDAPTHLVPPQSATALIRDMVSPEVASALTNEGTFASYAAWAGGDDRIIDAARARELAVAYLSSFGPFLREHIEDIHGRLVDFSSLTADPRVLLSEPANVDVPADVSGPLRKAYGAYYLVTVRSANDPIATIAVSVFATDLEVVEGV